MLFKKGSSVKGEYSLRFRGSALLLSIVFIFITFFVMPLSSVGAPAGYLPPTATLTQNDVIAANSGDMIVFPHMGTPGFVEPGGQLVVEVAADAGYGTSGWSVWVENEFQYWDCTVGAVEYGANKIYMDTRTGYRIPITIPSSAAPELLNLVVTNGSKTWRAPASISVVPVLNTSFYTAGITDTHFGGYLGNGGYAVGNLAKALAIGGVRFLSHTGDISLAPDVNRGIVIGRSLIGTIVNTRVPLIVAAGNHEFDKFITRVNDQGQIVNKINGVSIGNQHNNKDDYLEQYGLHSVPSDFDYDAFDRFFGMRSQIMMMGKFAVAKHDFGAYWTESLWLRNALTAKWNSLQGATYRLLMQHPQPNDSGNITPMFKNGQNPMPSPYPNLMIKGHSHQYRTDQTSPYVILSLGGNPYENGEFAMLNFNYNSQTESWTCPQAISNFQSTYPQLKMIPGDQSKADAVTALRESFSKSNNGTQTSNSCTITNDLNFNFYDGRTRYVMAKGVYEVQGGEIIKQYDSANGTKTIVLVRVNIPKNGSVTTSIAPVDTSSAPAPVLLSSVPEQGAENVSLFTDLVVRFSTQLNPGTVNKTNITCAQATIQSVTPINNDTAIQVVFEKPLALNTQHVVTFSNIQSSLGGVLESPVSVSFTTDSRPPYTPTDYMGPGDNAVPNAEFEYSFPENSISLSSGSSYTFETKEWTGTNPGGFNNPTRAIVVDQTTMFRDSGGDRVTIPLKNGFKFEAGKKYGVYLSAYSDTSLNCIAINVRWKEGFSNNVYHKSIQVYDTNTFNGWKGNGDIWDFSAPLGGSTMPDIDSGFDPVVELVYNTAPPLSSEPGQDLMYYDNLYITEITGEPGINEVIPTVSGGTASAIVVDLKYPVKYERFTGAGYSVTGSSGNVEISKVELMENRRSILIEFATPIPAGDYTVTLGSDLDDLWNTQNNNRPFTEKTKQFTVTEATSTGRYSFTSFGLFNGAEEITDGALPASATVTAKVTSLTNNTGEAGKVYLIMALFKDNRLKAVSSVNATIASGAAEPLLQSPLSIPALGDGDYTVKAFLWEDLLGMKPIGSLQLTE